MITEANVFIDFSIIKNSQIKELREELDTIIQLRNKIFLWSKVVTPSEMMIYCLSKTVPIDKAEKELHKKCYELRNIECLSYKEIEEKTGVKSRRIGFYSKVDPEKEWKLSDWILDYYKKDSSVYQKVDFIIDRDPKLIERFRKIGIKGNVIENL